MKEFLLFSALVVVAAVLSNNGVDKILNAMDRETCGRAVAMQEAHDRSVSEGLNGVYPGYEMADYEKEACTRMNLSL